MKVFILAILLLSLGLFAETKPTDVELVQGRFLLTKLFFEKQSKGEISLSTYQYIDKLLNAWGKKVTDPNGNVLGSVAKQYVFLNFYCDLLSMRKFMETSRHAHKIKQLVKKTEDALFKIEDSFSATEKFFIDSKIEIEEAKSLVLKQQEIESIQNVAFLAQKLGAIESSEAFLKAITALDESQSLKFLIYIQKGWETLFPHLRERIEDERLLVQLLHLKVAVQLLQNSKAVDVTPAVQLLHKIETVPNISYSAEIKALEEQVKKCFSNLSSDEKSLYAPALAPISQQKRLVQEIQFLKHILAHAKENAQKKAGFLSSVSGYTSTLNEHLDLLNNKLTETSHLIGNLKTIGSLEQASQDMHWITLLFGYVLDQIPEKSELIFTYSKKLMTALDAFGRGRQIMSPELFKSLRKDLLQERREGVYRAWVNRRNASTLAVSSLLLAEAIAIPFSGGASAAGMPATLHLLTTTATIGAKTVLIGDSALRIADRVTNEGAWGLAHLDTAFDALVILSLTPRPVPGTVVPTTTLGKVLETSKATLAQWQYSGGVLLTGTSALYGTYLIANAESISKALANEEGLIVSPAEIRRRGFLDLALSIIAATTNHNAYKEGLKKGGAAFEDAIKPATATSEILSMYKKTFHPLQRIAEFKNAHPNVYGTVGSVGLGAAYAAQYYFALNEAALFFFTNPDSRFMNHVEKEEPLPKLLAGETAVIMVGFEKADYFLYQAVHDMYSHHREVEAFGKDNVFIYDYDSPENFVHVLDRHRLLHGPIKYLKVATHGRPGRLFTPKVGTIPEADIKSENDGWITKEWIEKYAQDIKNMSRAEFADDARVVFWSCLTGANLDKEDGQGKDVGEAFLKAFGDHFLVNGGMIQASTRVLIGLEASVGPSLRNLLKSEYEKLSTEEKEDFKAFIAPPQLLDAPDAGPGDVATRLTSRIWNFFAAWPPYWVRYGTNLEGNWWWQGSYRSMKFEKQNP